MTRYVTNVTLLMFVELINIFAVFCLRIHKWNLRLNRQDLDLDQDLAQEPAQGILTLLAIMLIVIL